MIIDTHCHLDFSEFDFDRDQVLKRAEEAGVGYIINIASSLEGSRRCVELAARYEAIYASVGIHPHHAGDADEKTFSQIRVLVKNKKVVAVGEVGLDYCKNPSPKENQKRLFENFLDIAAENALPVVIHSREAHQDTLDMLKAYSLKLTAGVNGVVHCFSADEEYLKKYLDLGLFASFTCNLTFKNAATLREIAKKVPADRLLLETDAPFLAPQQFRGKRNEPSYLIYLVKEWAGILGLPEKDIERITTQNARKLFKL